MCMSALHAHLVDSERSGCQVLEPDWGIGTPGLWCQLLQQVGSATATEMSWAFNFQLQGLEWSVCSQILLQGGLV